MYINIGDKHGRLKQGLSVIAAVSVLCLFLTMPWLVCDCGISWSYLHVGVLLYHETSYAYFLTVRRSKSLRQSDIPTSQTYFIARKGQTYLIIYY